MSFEIVVISKTCIVISANLAFGAVPAGVDPKCLPSELPGQVCCPDTEICIYKKERPVKSWH